MLLSVLKTLQERIVEREALPGVELEKEKKAWKQLWNEWSPELFIYACSHGSVEAVKFFMEMDEEGSLLDDARYNDTILISNVCMPKASLTA